MQPKQLSIILLNTMFSSGLFAGTMGASELSASDAWVMTLSAGPVWESAGDAQTFVLAPNIVKSYTANKSSQALAEGELFVGLQNTLNTRFQSQLGLALAVTSNASLSGQIWDDASSTFDNYTYGYNIQHTRLSVKGKLLAGADYWLIPWISGSLGLGFNNAHAFHNTPLLFQALPNPDFTSYTATAFSYTLGAGVQKAFATHWQAGVGYEFADWGSSHLGRSAGQTLNSGLRLNHLYTNGILFNLTYLA